MHVDVAGLSHVGMKRAHNEDNLLILGEQGIFAIADGMGGHASGEVASKIAVDEIREFYLRSARGSDAEQTTWPFPLDPKLTYDENRLLTAVRLANLRIFEMANKEVRYRKMGTTVVALSLSPRGPLVAHVGDSRAYRLRAGKLAQLTEDHSLLNDYIKANRLTPQEIAKFPHKNVISRALGMGPDVKVDLCSERCQAGDVFLMCSDGLSGMVSDPELHRILTLEMAIDLKARGLIDAANAAGGSDNITAILLRIS